MPLDPISFFFALRPYQRDAAPNWLPIDFKGGGLLDGGLAQAVMALAEKLLGPRSQRRKRVDFCLSASER